MASRQFPSVIKSFFLLLLIIGTLFVVASYLFTIGVGPLLFFFTPEGSNASVAFEPALPVWLYTLIGFGVPIQLNVGTLFLLLWSIFVLCVVAAWQVRDTFPSIIRKAYSRPLSSLFHNHLFALPTISSMLLLAVILIQSLQEVGGIPTGEPPLPGNPFRQLFLLSWASLFEEIGFRVIPIGTFLLFYFYWTTRKNVIDRSMQDQLRLFTLTLLFPDRAKRRVGLRTVADSGILDGISAGEWGMLLFSSVVFGLAHYLGGGWEIGKISSAAIVGFAMGLTYLLYGVQAPILLHWFFNYYLWFFNPNTEGGLQFITQIHPSLSAWLAGVEFTLILLGVFGWLTYAMVGVYRLFRYVLKKALTPSEDTIANFPESPHKDLLS